MKSIRECVVELTDALTQEIENIVKDAKNHGLQLQVTLAETRLLRKKDAAELLGLSVSALDRKVASGEIAAVYLDSRPRFELNELKRVIEVRRVSRPRRRRR